MKPTGLPRSTPKRIDAAYRIVAAAARWARRNEFHNVAAQLELAARLLAQEAESQSRRTLPAKKPVNEQALLKRQTKAKMKKRMARLHDGLGRATRLSLPSPRGESCTI